MKKIDLLQRKKMFGMASIAAYAATGVCLLLWPALMTDLALWVLVGVLGVMGLIKLYKYLKSDPKEGAKNFELAIALIFLSLCLALICDRSIFELALPRIWGALLLAGAFVKVQFSVDFFRLKQQNWWWLLIGAAVSTVLGVLCATSPDFLKNILPQFIGASLVVEALIDVTAWIFVKKTEKQKKAPESAPVESPVVKEQEQEPKE